MNAARRDVGSWDSALRRSRLARATRLPAFVLMAGLAGCVVATTPTPRRQDYRATGDPVVDGNAALAMAADKDRSLYEYRIAAAAIRRGQFDEAEAKLDLALARLSGIVGNSDKAAQRSRTLFAGEDTKTFVGEPYERSMAYYYRGLLYWRAGEIDNARACFRAAEFADSDAEGEKYRGDYVLFDYLEGLASTRLAGDGGDAFARAAKQSGRELPSYAEVANVLFFVEFGAGPRKIAAGDYGEKLQFRQGATRVRSAAVTIAGQTVQFTPWDDLHYQATTRGGRVMDYILGQKAVFKGGADVVGDIALLGAQEAASRIYTPKPAPKADPKKEEPKKEESAKEAEEKKAEESRAEMAKTPEAERRSRPDREGVAKKEAPKKPEPPKPVEYEKNREAEIAAWTLGTIGVLSKIAAAATTPRADTRTWDNLPQYLSFGSLKLPPGEYEAKVEFFDVAEQRIDALTQSHVVRVGDPARDTVVILSELKR